MNGRKFSKKINIKLNFRLKIITVALQMWPRKKTIIFSPKGIFRNKLTPEQEWNNQTCHLRSEYPQKLLY